MIPSLMGKSLAEKVLRQRRLKRLRETLRQLRLHFFDYSGTDRIGKYNRVVVKVKRAIARLSR